MLLARVLAAGGHEKRLAVGGELGAAHFERSIGERRDLAVGVGEEDGVSALRRNTFRSPHHRCEEGVGDIRNYQCDGAGLAGLE